MFIWALAFLFINLVFIQNKELSKNQGLQTDPFSTATNVLAQYGVNQGWITFTALPRGNLFYHKLKFVINKFFY